MASLDRIEKTVDKSDIPAQRVRLQRLLAEEDVYALVQLFEKIAAGEGWQHSGELCARLDRSVFFGLWADSDDLVADSAETKELIGGLQLVGPDKAGILPCHKLWPETDAGRVNEIAYIAILAVRKKWRGKRNDVGASCFWTLTGALWRYCMDSGVTHLWLEATPTMLRCYRLLGWPLQVRGPLRVHWGEECYLCSLSLRETAGALVEKALRSRTYRHIIETALDTGVDPDNPKTNTPPDSPNAFTP